MGNTFIKHRISDGMASDSEASELSFVGQKTLNRIEQFGKSDNAAIQGFCMGGGLGLALKCHIRFASDKYVFGMPDTANSHSQSVRKYSGGRYFKHGLDLTASKEKNKN